MIKFGRRVAGIAVLAAAAAVAVPAGSASAVTAGHHHTASSITANAGIITWLDQPPHNAGIYNYSSVGSGKTGAPDLIEADGDGVEAVCWIRGDQLQGLGNVWYYIDSAYYVRYGYQWYTEHGYVYGGYVDGNWAYYNGLQHCSWGP